MQYRPDIAGLRAVAVLPILLFHAGISSLPGGFVGVDVFFVISGFLITSIILRDLERGRFSMAEFYRRRVARIVPALLVVLAATLAAGSFLMLPSELNGLASSAAMAAIFLSNFYFFFSAGYFGPAAEALPLLHTWSLAVEEQFYIFFPLVLLGIWQWKRGWLKGAILLACVLSFAVALWLGQTKRLDAAFYLIPPRAWELGVGAMVALGLYPRLGLGAAKVVACAGLAMIGVAVLFVRPGALFPAPLALLPCLGAAALIAYGRAGPTARLLSWVPVRRIGDISYSLYLWHWPVITFYRLQTGVHLSPVETVGLVAVSIALAEATWVWVEQPALARLRHGDGAPAAPRVAVGGFAALAVTALVAMALPFAAGQLRRYPQNVGFIAAFMDYRDGEDYRHQFRKGICLMGEDDAQTFNRDCLKTDPARRNMVIMGDSHAAQFWRAFADRYAERNVIQATASGCRPLIGATGEKRCTDLMAYTFAEVLKEPGVDTVVLSGRWPPGEVPSLVATVRELRARGLAVMVIGPTVEYDGDFPAIMARAVMAENAEGVEGLRLTEREALDTRLGPLIEEVGGRYVSAYRMECPAGGECRRLTQGGGPFHFDYGHLTLEASRDMVAAMPAL